MADKRKLAKRRPIRKAELVEIVERQLMSGKISLDDESAEVHARLIGLESRNAIAGWIKHYGFCEYSGEPIDGQEIDFDHKIPIAMQYEGDPIEWQVILRKWHKVKTKKDVADIAKAKRMAGETGQYARRMRRKAAGKSDLIKSRPSFPKAPEGHSRWPERKFGS